MMDKKWKILTKASDDIIDQLLANRGVSQKDKELFLYPDYERDLHDPFLMLGMKKAVERILLAIERKEKVGIFGDYDADGVPATAILYEIFTKHGLEVEIFIPTREEGYGMNERGIKYLAQKGVKLVVTVDMGITCKADVEMAKTYGIETIVTDHHEVIEGLTPDRAVAVIDAKQKKCKYSFDQLCGAGVAFKLGGALSQKTGKISENMLKWYLDLVAISTFCDMVPLVGENRVLAKYGLVVLKKTKRFGLEQLFLAAGIDREKITEYTVGFQIGPRLNAPGRVNNGNISIELLLSRNEAEAKRLAQELESSNGERQEILKKFLAQAEEEVVKKKLNKKKVIIIKGDNWPEGIIGLVAGRLTERYGRPAIVLSSKEGISKGSARSVEGFHLVEMLNECQDYLIKHGGHAKAAGLTVADEHLKALCDRIWELADKALKEEDLIPEIVCDAEVDLEVVNWKMYKNLELFEPFGMGNRRPVFVSRGVEVATVSTVGNGGVHIKFEVKKGARKIRGVGFDMGDRLGDMKVGEKIDIVYTVDYDAWLGGENLQLKLLDFKFIR